MLDIQHDPVPAISEPMTWNEICERYPDEWVCLVEIDDINENDFAFRTARVIGHAADGRTPLLQARAFHDRYDDIGHFYTGNRVRGRIAIIDEGAP